MKIVEVAVGVIKKGDDIFLCKRAENQHQGGKWEFPGGKKESGESISQALCRELLEEVGIEVIHQYPLMVIEHDYGDKCVKLDVRVVNEFTGEARGAEGQLSQWVNVAALHTIDFPEANQQIVAKLQQLG